MNRLRRQLTVALCSALLLVALALSGCAPLLSGVSGTPSALQGSSVLGWPFDIHAGSWVIENGYNTDPDHHGYELDSFDLQRQDAATTGQSVLSPASGDVIDIGSAYPGDYTSGHCARVSITGYAGYYVMVCHLVSVTAGHVNRGNPIGTVAGGPNGNHIHITLYYLPPGTPDTTTYAADRAAIPFSALWTIAGCQYPATGAANEWARTAVPCGTVASISTPTATPTATPTPTATFQASGATLCKADWSRGLDGWVGTPDWKAINGMLVNDGTNGADLETSPSLLAPCDLGGVANFTLEATIQVTSQGYDPGFDFFVRYTKPDQGYILGVTDQYNAANSLSGVTCTTADRFYQPIQTANFVPGGGFHTYVVTLSGDHIRLLIDNHVYLDVTDSQVASGPLIGLTDKDARLIVSSLSVIRG